jgi:hypothetical protein
MKFFFHKDDKESEQLFIRIAAACEGLIYVSETDAKVLPYAATLKGAKAPEVLIEHAGRKADEHVEEISSDELFDRLTAIKDWFGERETERAKKFLELRELLEEDLGGLKVFRLGRIQIDIFVVGLDKNEMLMGVTTKAVET